jgi:hypothetical protein
MTSWHYLDYRTPGGECPIREWMGQQDDEVIAALRTILYERRELDDWQRPPTRHMEKQFRVLTDEHIGLAELRFWTTTVFTTAKRTFRVAGWFRPEEHEFVLFTGCEKSKEDRIEDPPDAFVIALGFKADLEAGIGDTIAHEN